MFCKDQFSQDQHTSMQVGWQHKRIALQPVHYSYGLWLSGSGDVDKLVWKIAVQVKIVAVITPSVTRHITCKESKTEEQSTT